MITRKMILAAYGIGDGFTEFASYPSVGFVNNKFYISYDGINYLPFEVAEDVND